MSDYWNSYQAAVDRVRPVIPQSLEQMPSGNRDNQAVLQNVATGETIQGEIISMNGNEVLVKLPDQTVISAKLTADMQIFPGQKLLFEVQNSTDGQVSLRALFTNLAGQELLANALSDAGIPLNAESAEMVEQLVKEELPIGKEHLQKIYRDVLAYRELNPAEIVKMHKLGIEVDDQNVKQFSALLHYEERIAGETMKLIDSLQNEVFSLQAESKTEQAYTLEKQILSLLSESSEMIQFGDENALLTDKTEVLKVFQEVFSEQNLLSFSTQEGESLVNKEIKTLFDQLVAQISKGEGSETSVKELFSFLAKEAQLGHLPKEILNQLFEKEPFLKLVSKALEEQWLLKPNEVEDGKNINEFYQRLHKHVSSLSAMASEAVGASATLTQSLTQMKENVDFLNSLSQMIPYVQLPLKLNGQSATGDLYVFADKKSLSEKGENITAALHLDMEYLGHLDVFVKLVNTKVETDFKVESDATLQFLSDHIDVLNERLQKRGYDLTVNLDMMKEPASIKTDLMKGSNDEEIEKEPIAYYRLDVRA